MAHHYPRPQNQLRRTTSGNRCTSSTAPTMVLKSTEEDFKDLETIPKREVGHLAVWSVSTSKPGFGVEMLRDNRTETYWQSDGPQPHLVNIQFNHKMTICDIHLYFNYKVDESYTPSKISIRAGSHFHDVYEVELAQLNEPNGWSKIALRDKDRKPVKAFFFQIAVLSNHQNGRDTHIRQIKIHSPVEETMVTALDFTPRFSTRQFFEHAFIR